MTEDKLIINLLFLNQQLFLIRGFNRYKIFIHIFIDRLVINPGFQPVSFSTDLTGYNITNR